MLNGCQKMPESDYNLSSVFDVIPAGETLAQKPKR